MKPDHRDVEPAPATPSASIQLLREPLRASIEQSVSRYRGQAWRINDFRDMHDFASHPAAVLSDGIFAVFVKFSPAANALDQFEIEIAGLQLLSERAGVAVPTPIGAASVAGGAIMILEAVPAVAAVDRTPRQWKQIGRTLARIHRTKGEQFGLPTNGYFGSLFQDNRPVSANDWPSFYAERRLWPRLIGAIDSGNMPSALIRQVEQLIQRLPDLCGPEVAPRLLHGDAQKNNFISTDAGAVVIDPAAYFGHSEMDLATLDFFEPVPADVFVGYQEEMPIDPGFMHRRDLWRIYGYLACVTLAGHDYLDRLAEAVRKYL